MPDVSARGPRIPDSRDPFDRAVISAANQFREESNLEPSDDLAEAAVIVLGEIVAAILERAGANHTPHPDSATIETATCAACFMGACLTGLFTNLKKQGIELDIPAVFTRTGFTIFQWYSPQEEAKIILSGGDAFKKLLETAPDHPNVREWIEDVQQLTAAYVLTRDTHYLSLLTEEYLSLWQAHDRGLDTTAGK